MWWPRSGYQPRKRSDGMPPPPDQESSAIPSALELALSLSRNRPDHTLAELTLWNKTIKVRTSHSVTREEAIRMLEALLDMVKQAPPPPPPRPEPQNPLKW